MAFTGLIPSEHSSGPKQARGPSPKPAMRICDACWSKPPGSIAITRISDPVLQRRQRGAPAARDEDRLARPTALAPPLPLSRRPRQTQTTHRHRVARELTGFLWAALAHLSDRPTSGRRTLVISMR